MVKYLFSLRIRTGERWKIQLYFANNVWMMICTGLVFFMHLGFSFLEIGLTRQKNTVNILFKNFFVITIGLLLYMIGGFNLMYPGFEEGSAGFFKFAGFGIGAPEGGMTPGYADGGYTWWTIYFHLLQPLQLQLFQEQ